MTSPTGDMNGNATLDAERVKTDAEATEEQVVRHLLFHKALIADDEDPDRLNQYLTLVREGASGEHVSITDPFDRAIALAFELVLENHLDPWKIDLVQFASLYLEQVRAREELDLITAGRILLMAWTILKMQSDVVKEHAEPPEPEPEFEDDPWFGVEGFDFEDPDTQYNTAVIEEGRVPIDEKIRHKGDRKVTFMELLEALEEAKQEAEMRAEIVAKREAEKRQRKARSQGRADGAAHKEDQEADIAEVWGRINGFNGHPIPLADIRENDREDLVKTLVSVLFLARSRKIDLWQEDFPYGSIYVKNTDGASSEHDPESGSGEDASADSGAGSDDGAEKETPAPSPSLN